MVSKRATSARRTITPKVEAPEQEDVEHVDASRSSKRRKVQPAPEEDVIELEAIPDVYNVPGKVFVMGTGDCGQLGLGEDVTEKLRPGPVTIDGETDTVLQVVAGGMHTVCLCASGTVYSWGVNDEGALGRFTEGELWRTHGRCTGKPGISEVPVAVAMPPGSAKVVMLSAGDSHTAALTDRGEVYVWGTFRDSGGVMGFSDKQKFSVSPSKVWSPGSSKEQVILIQSGNDHIAALTRGKAVITWGSGQQGQLGRVGARINDRQHSALHVYTTPGTMHVPHLSGDKVDSIACGSYCTFVVTGKGKVFGSGLNNYQQLGTGSADAICFGTKRVKALTGVAIAQVASGEHHTLALSKVGEIWSFGRPTYGRLGQKGAEVNTDNGVSVPGLVPVEDQTGSITGIAAGSAVSGCITDSMCGLWLCGCGTSGQLAKGADDEDDEETMKKVKMTKVYNTMVVSQLSFGGQHAVALCTPVTANTSK